MNWRWILSLSLLLVSPALAGQKKLSIPVTLQTGGTVSDADKNGTFDKVRTGEKQGMEWAVGNHFLGPMITVMEFSFPQDWQDKTITITKATLVLSANGNHGTHPDSKPELAPDCELYTYTGKQVDGKITATDVQDEDGKLVGNKVGLFIESQTPLKAGRQFKSDVTETLTKVLKDKATAVGFRIHPKTLPDTVAYWRWRNPKFAEKYGKNYCPTLIIQYTAE